MHKALLFAVLALAATAPAGAQNLYKCKADGRVTYQSMPCAKGGEAIDVPPPPTAAQVKAAQARAQEDRERAQQLASRNREEREKMAKAEEEDAKQAAADKPLAKPDCNKLRARREELYGQRNVDRRNANPDVVAKTQGDIDRLEAEYTKAACGPLD